MAARFEVADGKNVAGQYKEDVDSQQAVHEEGKCGQLLRREQEDRAQMGEDHEQGCPASETIQIFSTHSFYRAGWLTGCKPWFSWAVGHGERILSEWAPALAHLLDQSEFAGRGVRHELEVSVERERSDEDFGQHRG